MFNRFRALPIPRWAPLAGRILADAVKQALDIALLLAVGYLLGFRLATSVVHLIALGITLVFAPLSVHALNRRLAGS